MARQTITCVVLALALYSAPLAVRGDDYDAEAMGGGDYGGDDEYGGGGYGDEYGGGGGYGGDEYGGGGGGYGDDYGGGGGDYDAGPAYSTIDTFEGIDEFLQEDAAEPAVLGLFSEEADAEEIEKFQSAATDNRYDYRWAYSTESAVRDAMKVKGMAVFVYLPPKSVSEKYDKPKARYPSKKIDASSLLKFVAKKSLPLVGQKTWKSTERYEKTGLPTLTLFTKIDLEKNAKGYEYFANRLRRVATDYKGRVNFNLGDKEDFSYLLEDYELELPEKKDVGVGIKDGAAHYHMEATFSVDALKQFLEDFLAGNKLTPKIKEESASDDHGGDSGADPDPDSEVIALTAENFAEHVDESGNDVMIEFYAPWCGHCQSLKHTYKALADQFLSSPKVTIAAMDATAHDPPAGYEVSGYPTIYFKPAGGTPVSYDGEREVDDMKAYIQTHGKAKDEL